jgi:elongation factor Tu
MNQRMILQRGLAITMLMFYLSGCAGAAPTPIEVDPQVVSTPVPSNPQVVQPRVVTARPSATTRPTNPGPTTTPDGSETATPTLPSPIDRPFLMQINKVSVIVGRGTLLEGRVTNGTLQAGVNIEIIGPRDNILSASLLAILVSNTGQQVVTVGDYARILVGGIEPADLRPGMFLAAAGEFESYEDVLYQLQ